MTHIHLVTKINAPRQIVFDLSRDIGVHQFSASATREKAIAGTTSGLIGLGETVTWQARHFGIRLRHKSRITAFEAPRYFVDEMEKGHFKTFRHEHFFEADAEQTTMIDHLYYTMPCGLLGWLIDRLLLRKHLRQFIETRNTTLKGLAEKHRNDVIA